MIIMSFLKRIFVFVFSWAIIWYLIYLLFNWVKIVDWSEVNNYIVYWLFFLIFLYYIVFYTIKPTYFKWTKLVNTLLWLFIVYTSQTLINSWFDGIYYWDIFSVIGVVLTIIWPTNLLISKEVQKIKEYKNSEIIEIE